LLFARHRFLPSIYARGTDEAAHSSATAGFENLLEALADPEHPEDESLRAWVGGSFDPEEFDPAAVVFGDPKARLRLELDEQLLRRLTCPSGCSAAPRWV
jgi:hypothetical protein